MNYWYMLKTANCVPSCGILARVTHTELTPAVSHQRHVELGEPNPDFPGGCLVADMQDMYGNDKTYVYPENPNETSTIEVDLYSPLTALSVVRCFRARNPEGQSLLHTAAEELHRTLLYNVRYMQNHRRQALLLLLADLDRPRAEQ